MFSEDPPKIFVYRPSFSYHLLTWPINFVSLLIVRLDMQTATLKFKAAFLSLPQISSEFEMRLIDQTVCFYNTDDKPATFLCYDLNYPTVFSLRWELGEQIINLRTNLSGQSLRETQIHFLALASGFIILLRRIRRLTL